VGGLDGSAPEGRKSWCLERKNSYIDVSLHFTFFNRNSIF
jgi:hypothetical protein